MAIRMTLVALVCAIAGNVYAQEPLAPSPGAARAGASAVTTGNVEAAALREDGSGKAGGEQARGQPGGKGEEGRAH